MHPYPLLNASWLCQHLDSLERRKLGPSFLAVQQGSFWSTEILLSVLSKQIIVPVKSAAFAWDQDETAQI